MLSAVQQAIACIVSDGLTPPTVGNIDPSHTQRLGMNRCLLADMLQEVGFGELAQRLGELEESMGAGTTRVDDPLRDALMVKVGDFFPQNEVFQQGRPTSGRLEGILVLADDDALVCRHECGPRCRLLMQRAAGSGAAGLRGLRRGMLCSGPFEIL